MKAVLAKTYRKPEELEISEIPVPSPKENEVIVKVKATTINDWDWALVRGKPMVYRLLYGLFKPKKPIPGMELSGIVRSVGSEVTSFKEGDEVFGDTSQYGWGTFAEYACVNEKSLLLKPEKMSFEDAAAMPHASLLAWQSLVDIGKVSEGMKILVNGAGGGMGTFGLQIAKTFNCQVTGVDSGAKLEMMKALGFDEVIDYQKEDFTQKGVLYDLIIDAKTTRSPSSYIKCLKPGGKYITVGGSPLNLIRLLLSKIIYKDRINILGLVPNKGLDIIVDLYLEGKIKTQLDGPYPFEKIPELIRYFGEARHKGKIVVKV
ncbi:NAD(P)-dependent alcohol dehydrogenase [Jiulongibacter sediminis]|uniref:Alcohol dehydrogenase n=1 Tax=Jiulongibacter sediminis TaxID=1605367 RepID=A0A0P7BST9_9BACT|nr:NAD(P)-dependent alcohol dehydrogenase [Jiulongibacter sediminis]KPM47997.1 alcohol dehydrogenase [Jiulongibacter sediminis]TBX24179.1 alcohol dehydrogenase [Jiulongibacter sediminis]